jgi:GH43 family beta-xylosidase
LPTATERQRRPFPISERTYTNPIHEGYLGDPFVLKHNGEYYAYGTAPPGELIIPVLHSRDLVGWRPLGDASTLDDDAFQALWAPEVAYDNGTFYLYYSAGGEEGQRHQLRVAAATRPTGPFEDSGAVLTPEDPFTIDAHPFRDDDGQWYLYYCRDFLDSDRNERVGTGIVVDRLVGMTRLAGERRTVVQPHAGWQLYERQRKWYGRVGDWYTVEGPFVHKHDGRYYCFYSGGAWKEPNYGVSYVVADEAMGPFAPEEGAEGPEILRTRLGRVIGPGHASVIHAPDNVDEYIVYHAWDPEHTSRLMRMDRLNWGEEGPSSPGPTLDPQPVPTMPRFRDGFDGPDGAPPDPGAWRVNAGDWRQQDGELVQHDSGARSATAQLASVPPYEECLFEANVRLVEAGHEHGRYGICMSHGPEYRTSLTLTTDGSSLLCARGRDTQEFGRRSSLRALGAGFRCDAYHRLLVSVRGGKVEVQVDGVRVASGIEVPPGAGGVGLLTWGASAAFDGVSVTSLAGR